ncbi:tetrahydrofolate dehydrogenase/cyclohydrolase catalytic domain-containing protein [Nocardiopsis eucommiae]|uniref:tetrahydrofolate dehydrogenase/cyclohydrolase catalytic domain-containing protein n=1 Tax=Nocardiopsis eucommiae TaxID=2831970 RepID=UPI003D7475E6
MPGKGDNHIKGRKILSQVKQGLEHYQDPIRRSGSSISVIRFTPTEGLDKDTSTKLDASRISAEQKQKNFTAQGFESKDIALPYDVSLAQFREEIKKANEDPRSIGIIVQMPAPPRLMSGVQEIDSAKDIDGLLAERSQQRACATADGITRVALPFTSDGAKVAVIGSKGFVGSGVVRLLRDKGIEPVALDLGDDLKRARECDVIISVTGSPGIIGPDVIGPHHRAVVESGFVPQPGGKVLGDVRHEAYDLPQRITPVPGGIGPVEMAVLVERGIQNSVDKNLKSWSYDGQNVTAGVSTDPTFARPNREPVEIRDQAAQGTARSNEAPQHGSLDALKHMATTGDTRSAGALRAMASSKPKPPGQKNLQSDKKDGPEAGS